MDKLSNDIILNIFEKIPIWGVCENYDVVNIRQSYDIRNSRQGYEISSSRQGYEISNSHQGYEISNSRQGYETSSSRQGYEVSGFVDIITIIFDCIQKLKLVCHQWYNIINSTIIKYANEDFEDFILNDRIQLCPTYFELFNQKENICMMVYLCDIKSNLYKIIKSHHRKKKFNNIAVYYWATNNNYLKIIKYLDQKNIFSEQHDPSKLIMLAIKNNNFEMVKYLQMYYKFKYIDPFLRQTIKYNRFNIFEYFYSIDENINYHQCIILACKYNRLNMIKFLRKNFVDIDVKFIIQTIDSNHVNIVKYWCENGSDINISYHGLKISLEIMYVLKAYGNNNCTDTDLEIINAIICGDLITVKYLYSDLILLKNCANNYLFVCLAIQNGHLDIIKYFLKINTVSIKINYKIFNIAISAGHLQIVKYLYKKFNINFIKNNKIFNQSIISGNFELVKYLIDIKYISDYVLNINDYKGVTAHTFEKVMMIIKYIRNIYPNIIFESVKLFKKCIKYGTLSDLKYLMNKVDPKLLFEISIVSNKKYMINYLYDVC